MKATEDIDYPRFVHSAYWTQKKFGQALKDLQKRFGQWQECASD